MRAIVKGSEPDSLREHRVAGGTYNDFRSRGKQKLREALVTEQRGLCCYCMSRISADSSVMRIEHWQSQSGYPGQQLVYANLLAACLGGQGHAQHCDTSKAERDLKFNPADPLSMIESLISYGLDGTIWSRDVKFNDQLDTVLGLNIAQLKNSRKAILTAFAEWLRLERDRLHRPVPREVIKRKRDKLLSQTHDSLEPFVQVKIWWLEQRLAR